MKPRIMIGLLFGLGGFVFNSCTGNFLTFLVVGPLILGGMAARLAIRDEKLIHRRDGVRAGAIASGIAGALAYLLPIVFVIGMLFFSSPAELETMFGIVPSLSNPLGGLFSSWYLLINLAGMFLTIGSGVFVSFRETKK